MSLAPGTRLGRYTIAASIGAGGMGEVRFQSLIELGNAKQLRRSWDVLDAQ